MFMSSLIRGLSGAAAIALVMSAPTFAAASGPSPATGVYSSGPPEKLSAPPNYGGKARVNRGNERGKAVTERVQPAEYGERRRHRDGYGSRHHSYHDGHLPRRVIRRILRHRGFYGIEFIDRRGDRYVARAYDRRGRYVRVAFDAYSGELIRKKYLSAGGYGHHNDYLSVRQLRHRLAHQGFHRVHRVRMRHGHYYAHSYDKYGSPIRLTVNAYNGHVIACDPIY